MSHTWKTEPEIMLVEDAARTKPWMRVVAMRDDGQVFCVRCLLDYAKLVISGRQAALKYVGSCQTVLGEALATYLDDACVCSYPPTGKICPVSHPEPLGSITAETAPTESESDTKCQA